MKVKVEQVLRWSYMAGRATILPLPQPDIEAEFEFPSKDPPHTENRFAAFQPAKDHCLMVFGTTDIFAALKESMEAKDWQVVATSKEYDQYGSSA